MARNDISGFAPEEAPEFKIDKITKAIREGLQISPSDNFDEGLNSIKDKLYVLSGYQDFKKQVEESIISKVEQLTTSNKQQSKIIYLQAQCDSLRVQYATLNKKIEQLSPNTDISAFEKNADVSSLQDYVNKLSELVKNYGFLAAQVAELYKEIGTIQTDSTLFAKKTDVSSLKGRVVELKDQVEKNHSDLDNKFQELSQKINDFHNGTAAQDTSPETGKSRPFGKCIFICAILLFNILATSIIICCPRYLGEVDPLPWFGVVLLIACLFLNIVGSGIWLYEYYLSEEYTMKKGNIIFTIVVEGTLLVLNTVVMWLFASNPLQGITDASIALTVTLVCANFAMLMLRVLYFLDEYNIVVKFDLFNLIMNIIGAAGAAATVIALVFATVA